MNYSKWYSCWGLSPRVSIDPNGSWRGGLSDTKHVRRTCKICSSTIWQWRGESPPQDMPRSDLNGLALGTRLASGLSWARQKYVFVPYRELAYITRPHEWRIIMAQWGKNLNSLTAMVAYLRPLFFQASSLLNNFLNFCPLSTFLIARNVANGFLLNRGASH